MNWELAFIILAGVLAFYVLCMFLAVIEEEWRKRREQKRWDDWVNRER